MKKNITPSILFLVVAVLIIGVVILADKIRSNDTSLSEIIGGTRVYQCSDSDGEYDYTSEGTCRGTNGDFVDYCQDSYLKEYYCSYDSCLAKSVSCPSGYTCSDGACVASLTVTACSGSVALKLTPSTVAKSDSVTASASGLSGCDGKTVYFRKGSGCDPAYQPKVSACSVSGSGCTGQKFTAPSSAGTYYYTACIDKNGDGSYTSTDEMSLAILKIF